MEENRRPADLEKLNNPEVRHEPSDINVRAITKFGIVFVLLGIVMHFVIWYVFDLFRGREQVKGPPPSQGINVDARKLPPEPRLQSAPILDLHQMRAAEDQILNSYGWLDQSRGIVRIPVSRAMDLIANQSLPVRTSGPAPRSASTATIPTESGLGPIVQQAGGPLSPNRTFPPDQPLEIHGNGSDRDGRAAGGPPTPAERSLANTGPAAAAEAPPRGPQGITQHGTASTAGSGPTAAPSHPGGGGQTPGTLHDGGPEQQQRNEPQQQQKK